MAILQDLKNGLNKSKQVFGKITNSMSKFNKAFDSNPVVKSIDKIASMHPIVNANYANPVSKESLNVQKKVIDRTLNVFSAVPGAILSRSELRNPNASPLDLVKASIGGAKQGAVSAIKGEDKYNLAGVVPKKLGLKGPAGLLVGLAAEVAAPGPGELAALNKAKGVFKADDISKAATNSLFNIPDSAKAGVIEKFSVKEALTGLAESGKNLKGRILISLNDAGETILEDGRHLLEAYRMKGLDIPADKVAFASKEAKEAFENFGKISSLVDGGVPKDPVKTLTSALKEAAVKRKEQEAIYTATRGKRFSEGYAARSGGGIEGFVGAKTAMSGEMEKVTMEALSKSLDQPTINGLFDKIAKSDLDQGDYLNAGEGLKNLLEGSVPTESQLKLLNDLFPSDLVSNLINNKSAVKKFMEGAGEVVNIPRALMASFDMSAPFRQGVFMTSRPKQFLPAMRDMFKYAFSPKAYEGLMQDIKSRPTYGLMEASNLSITDLGKLSNREETFMSNLAERLPIVGPVVKSGNRSYSGFLNKLRADVFDDLVKKGTELGVDFNGKAGQDLAKFINSATGRGDIGKLGDAAPLINGLFFSPRLMKSRIDLLNPTFYAKLDPFVRKEALKSLFTFAGTGLTILGLAKMGGAEVEDDPRSADFGKIKTGNTRYDIWGGFQQYIKLAAQLTTGELKSSTTGEIYKTGVGYKPITRLDLVYRFLEQKESPVPSFVTGLLKGKTATGEEFEVSKEVIDRVIPLILQDLKDVYQESGSAGLGKQIPAFFGIGTQTYSDVSRKGAKPFSSSTVKVAKPKPKVTPKPKPTPKY